jgi:hypothetical protein
MATPPDFSVGATLTAAQMNAVGMWRVTTCTVSSVGGTAASASDGVITVGSGNTSLTVSNAFSANFDAYRIIWDNGALSGGSVVLLQLGASTTGYYNILNFGASYGTPTPSAVSKNNANAFGWAGFGDTNYVLLDVELFDPFLSKYTGYRNSYMGSSNAGTGAGLHQVATSYSSFTLTPESAVSFSSGKIRVYGYKK